jgi:hypothetical protein
VSERSNVTGRIILLAGLFFVFLAGLSAGALMHTGTEGDAGTYDPARASLFAAALWVAAGFVLWGAGRLRLFLVATALVAVGMAIGWLGLGDLDAGGSEDSKEDIGLVIGSVAALIGLFIAWAGARLVWPSTSKRSIAKNPSPTS